MNEISLCTGIGGFGLAARWMGWQSVATCEIDPFCQRVIKKNFPNAYHHDDLFTLTADILETEIKARFGTEWRKPGVILTAGLPCQPFSVAGKRDGQNDARFLWPQSIRLVQQLRPDVCVFENVAGLLSILEPDSVSEMERESFGLFDENNNEKVAIVERIKRRVIGRIINDLEQAGYLLPRAKDGTPIVFVVPACAVEAIHRRDRVWICAYAKSAIGQRAGATRSGRNGHTDACGDIGGVHSNATSNGRQKPDFAISPELGQYAGRAHANDTDPNGIGRQNGRHGQTTKQETPIGIKENDQHGNGVGRHFGQVEWQPNDTTEILRTAYGIPGWVDGRIRNRNARIKALGNAIVPQVAYHLFAAIEEIIKNKFP